MHFICQSVIRKHFIPESHPMHLNRRVMRSNYRRFVGRVTDWFEAPETVHVPTVRRLA